MTTSLLLFFIPFCSMLCAMFFFVLFGQITVRKLRKKPETKDALGLEFASGWDIFNVAQSLSLPRRWIQKLEERANAKGVGTMFAKSDMLYKHTNKFDRFLARFLFWLNMFSLFSMLIFAILFFMGVVTPDG